MRKVSSPLFFLVFTLAISALADRSVDRLCAHLLGQGAKPTELQRVLKAATHPVSVDPILRERLIAAASKGIQFPLASPGRPYPNLPYYWAEEAIVHLFLLGEEPETISRIFHREARHLIDGESTPENLEAFLSAIHSAYLVGDHPFANTLIETATSNITNCDERLASIIEKSDNDTLLIKYGVQCLNSATLQFGASETSEAWESAQAGFAFLSRVKSVKEKQRATVHLFNFGVTQIKRVQDARLVTSVDQHRMLQVGLQALLTTGIEKERYRSRRDESVKLVFEKPGYFLKLKNSNPEETQRTKNNLVLLIWKVSQRLLDSPYRDWETNLLVEMCLDAMGHSTSGENLRRIRSVKKPSIPIAFYRAMELRLRATVPTTQERSALAIAKGDGKLREAYQAHSGSASLSLAREALGLYYTASSQVMKWSD